MDGSGALLICGSHTAASSNHNHPRLMGQSALHSSLQDLSHIRHSSPYHGADLTALAGTGVGVGAGVGTGFQTQQDDDMFDDHGADDWDGGDDYYDNQQQDAPPHGATSDAMWMGTPAKPIQAAPVLAGLAGTDVMRATKPRKERVHKDMFAQLDPHQVVSGSREARRGKTYKIPPALLQPPPVTPSLDYLYADVKPSNASMFLTSGAVPEKGLFDGSLLPILALKRKILRQARLVSARMSRNNNLLHEEDEAAVPYQNLHLGGAAVNLSRAEEQWAQDYADYGSDGGGDFGGGGGDDDDYDDTHSAPAGGAFAGEDRPVLLNGARRLSGLSQAENAAWEDQEDASEEEALARRVAMVLNEDMNQSTRTSYESICQKYIDNFNQGAHLFAK